jgi:hypothetical protein
MPKEHASVDEVLCIPINKEASDVQYTPDQDDSRPDLNKTDDHKSSVGAD